ncbi:hypothetical protein [Qipengyuania gaetbuli]|uniref:hypothetical protein n=1 Tax=Qipengyuania gaetbuli TaxID=266952 RepID=UPI001CFEEAD3|nr:hypothetical protein [Qipengyuania gaetbuli]
MQSLHAMRHFDFDLARACSYDQVIEAMRMLKFGRVADLKSAETRSIIEIIRAAISSWDRY